MSNIVERIRILRNDKDFCEIGAVMLHQRRVEYSTLPSLEAHEELLNTQKSPARLVDVKRIPNFGTNVGKSRVAGMPAGDDDSDFEDAVGLGEEWLVRVGRRFRELQEVCRVFRRNMLDLSPKS